MSHSHSIATNALNAAAFSRPTSNPCMSLEFCPSILFRPIRVLEADIQSYLLAGKMTADSPGQ